MPAPLDDLLALVGELGPTPASIIERLAHLLCARQPDASAEELGARLAKVVVGGEAQLVAPFACVAAHLERHPDALAGAIAGPPLRVTMVLTRALRLQWFERLAAVADETRARIAWHYPVSELDGWGGEAERGCGLVCEAFGLRHRVRYLDATRRGGGEVGRALAEEAWAVAPGDWNGGRLRRLSVLPWAVGAVASACAEVGALRVAEEVIGRVPADAPERAEMLQAFVRWAVRHGDVDRGDWGVGLLERVAPKAVDAARGVVMFARAGGDVARFVEATGAAKGKAAARIRGALQDAFERRDVDAVRGLLARMTPAQGFARIEEDLDWYTRQLVELLRERGDHAGALELVVKSGATHGAVRLAYLAALDGDVDVARSLLAGRSDEIARCVAPLLGDRAALPGDASRRERFFAKLFELEAELGHSPAIPRDAAAWSAPPFRPPRVVPKAEALPVELVAQVPGPVDDSVTFADLGIPFALFEAPVGSCGRYVGRGFCAVTKVEHPRCFEVDAIRVTCASCGGRAYAGERAGACAGCGREVEAAVAADATLVASYDAIAQGDAVFALETELGPLAGGVIVDARAEVDRAALAELAGTPPYTTWQGESWLFHCERPMVFVGELTPDEVTGRELAADARQDLGRVSGDFDPEREGLMTFRCRRCGMHRFHFDAD